MSPPKRGERGTEPPAFAMARRRPVRGSAITRHPIERRPTSSEPATAAGRRDVPAPGGGGGGRGRLATRPARGGELVRGRMEPRRPRGGVARPSVDRERRLPPPA